MNLYNMRNDFVRDGLLDFIESLPSDIVLIEIGCFAGQSTQMFLDSGKIKKMICIDKWETGYDPSDIASSQVIEAKKVFDSVISKYDNVQVIREYSDDAVKYISELVDVVYIDGNHQYQQVKKDILNYKTLLKKNGILSGHDYHLDGVKRAVTETIGIPDITFKDYSWKKRM